MHTEADPAASPHRKVIPCPRCGYDLGGIIERWKRDAAPGGPCSECGLPLTWRRLDATSRRDRELEISRDRFFFEMGRDRLVSRFVSTSLRTMFPPAMFPWITKRQRIQWPRLWGFFTVWICVWFVVAFGPLLAMNIAGADYVTVLVVTYIYFAELVLLLFVWMTSVLGVVLFTRKPLRPRGTFIHADHMWRTAIYAVCGLLCIDTVLLFVRQGMLLFAYLLDASAASELLILAYAIALCFCALYLLAWSMMWCVCCASDYFCVRKAYEAWVFPVLMLFLTIVAVFVLVVY